MFFIISVRSSLIGFKLDFTLKFMANSVMFLTEFTYGKRKILTYGKAKY